MDFTCGRWPRGLRCADVGVSVVLGILAQLVGEKDLAVVQAHVTVVAEKIPTIEYSLIFNGWLTIKKTVPHNWRKRFCCRIPLGARRTRWLERGLHLSCHVPSTPLISSPSIDNVHVADDHPAVYCVICERHAVLSTYVHGARRGAQQCRTRPARSVFPKPWERPHHPFDHPRRFRARA